MANKELETITIDLDKDILYELMLMAHQQDITLNVLISNILNEAMKGTDVKQV
jgi:predicted HicB family RNase H-like nuclease